MDRRKKRKRPKDKTFISSQEIERGKGKEITGTPGENPAKNRPGGFNKRTPAPYREMKQGLIEIFNKSNGKAILLSMLNMKVPEQLKPNDFDPEDDLDDRMIKGLMLNNFKWAVSQIIKLAPKEIGIFGNVRMEHSLAGLAKRATTGEKSARVIDLVKKRRERELLSHQNPLPQGEEEPEVWEEPK